MDDGEPGPAVVAELRHHVRLRLAKRRPTHALGISIDVAIDSEPERVRAVRAVPHLRERDAKLGGPPDAGVLPDGVGGAAVCAVNDMDALSATVNIKPEITPCVCITFRVPWRAAKFAPNASVFPCLRRANA